MFSVSRPRRWLLAAFTLGVLALAAAGPLRPWIFSRSIELTIDFHNATFPWKLEWQAADAKIIRNGHWIDLSTQPNVVAAAGAWSTSRPVSLRWGLPWYDISTLRLDWDGAPPGEVRVRRPRVRTRLLGYDVNTRTLGEPTADATGVSLPLPKHAPWEWAAGAGVALALLGSGVAFWMAVAFIERVWSRYQLHRLKAPGTPPTTLVRLGAIDIMLRSKGRASSLPGPSRLAAAGCFAIAVLAPIWMFAWAPLKVTTDGTEYLWLAQRYSEHLTTAWYDGWRMPGYPLLLAPLMSLPGLALVIGGVHALLGLATSLLAFGLVRQRVGGWAPYLAMLIAATHPMVIAWQRTTMTETLAAFLLLALMWVLAWLASRLTFRRWGQLLAGGIALGVLAGYAALVRSNFQVLLVLVPAVLLTMGLAARRVAPAVAACVVCVLSVGGILAPWVMHIDRNFGRLALAVGPGFSAQLQSWQNGTMDWNQSGVLSFAEHTRLIERLGRPPFGEYDYSDIIVASKVAPTGAALSLRRDVAGGIVARESFARRGDDHGRIALRAVLSQLGMPVSKPVFFQGSVDGWLMDILNRASGSPTTCDFPMALFPREERLTLLKAVRPMPDATRTVNGKVFGAWWEVWRALRPLGTLLFCVAMWRLVVRRDWLFAEAGLWYLANTLALAVLVYAGEDRFAMPFYPLMAVVTCVGLALPPRAGAAIGVSTTPTRTGDNA
ncbi:MAG: hypothetical protein WC718_12050 [Phycisphaerales bacterium]|jgi:hypothetical protein